jgi:hypothetical protein
MSRTLLLCGLFLLLAASSVWSAPKPKAKGLQAGDECVATHAFVINKEEGKGPKETIAAGARSDYQSL